MKVERIDHVGVIVEDLADAVATVGEVLGAEIGDRVERESLRAAFLSCGGTDIELIEILDPDLRQARLGDGAKARIEHIAVEVAELDAALEALEALGVRAKGPARDAERYRMFWTVPETTGGIMFQFVQPRAAERSPANVIRAREADVFDRGMGVRTTHLVTPERGAESFVNGITEFEPGAALPFHFHNCDESVVVLGGAASFELEDELHELRPDDTVFVPAGTAHRFVNAGTEPLRIFFTYGSAAATRTMLATGETMPIGSARDRLGGARE